MDGQLPAGGRRQFVIGLLATPTELNVIRRQERGDNCISEESVHHSQSSRANKTEGYDGVTMTLVESFLNVH